MWFDLMKKNEIVSNLVKGRAPKIPINESENIVLFFNLK